MNLKMCQPCGKVQMLTHIDCTDPYGNLGLCQCWVTSWVHCSKFDTGWTSEEVRDHEHDTGEDEFDTWIARDERDEIGG